MLSNSSLVRQKCKELTALLADEERLRAERAKNRAGNSRSELASRSGSRNNLGSQSLDSSYYNEDAELKKALEASKRTAEEEESRRRAIRDSDEDLQKAISLSEQELRNSKTQQEQ